MTIMSYALMIAAAFFVDFRALAPFWRSYVTAVFLLFFLFKFILIFFVFFDDIIRMIKAGINYFQGVEGETAYSPSRNRFLNQIGVLIAATPVVTLLYGMIRNAYNYKYRRVDMAIKNLPAELEGLKIVQISDIHSGSFTMKTPINKAIEMINAENPDLVFFTGDLVNSVADEIHPYIDIFKQIKAKEGVYSIIGNHDYGRYRFQKDDQDGLNNNFEVLKTAHKDMGWRLLLNEHEIIQKGNAKLAVIGVENWSHRDHFPSTGDLDKAYAGCENADVKVLLSHDPSHWRAEVTERFNDIVATFSGHTHGFQFGIDIAGLKWSPAKIAYPEWDGTYTEGEQYLHVNRGFGFLGYPGRVGMLPEITVAKLKKA